MIVTEACEIGNARVHTYSDTGYTIINEDGVEYAEAYDTATANHTYTESTTLIEGDNNDSENQ